MVNDDFYTRFAKAAANVPLWLHPALVLGAKYGLNPPDPADDGPEIEIIRHEMQIDAGRALHWTDADGHVLAHPMTTEEASQKGISI